MSVFTARKLKESRTVANLTLDEAAERMQISRRRLGYIESNENQPTSDEIIA
ncbi:MAG: helix-turn-helix domain-containing protein, partial [Clostridia bacterium]|nr:helix-turn-helix domain-containing protein [Clostridia bacterium]